MNAPRDESLDIARGAAIIMVVLGHVLGGVADSSAVAPGAGWQGWLGRAVYLTHLPVFALVTGLLMPTSVEKAGGWVYLRRRLALFAYLYLLWTAIQGGAEVVTSPWKNHPTTWLDVVTVWSPIAHLWFLPTLAVCTCIIVLIRPWRQGSWHVGGSVLAMIGGLALWGKNLPVFGGAGLALLAWFVLGAWVTRRAVARVLDGARRLTLAASGTAGLAVLGISAGLQHTAPTLADPNRTLLSISAGLVGTCGGVVAVLALSALAARGQRWWWAGLAAAGRLSLQIYLAHIIFAAGTRVLLGHSGVFDPIVHVVAGTVAGVAGPLLLVRVTRPLPWLFTPPWELRRVPRAGVPDPKGSSFDRR